VIVVKSIEASSIPLETQGNWPTPFGNWEPADSNFFGIEFNISLGPPEQNIADDFKFFVCSHKFYQESTVEEQRAIRSVKHLILASYDWKKIHDEISWRITKCSGPTWIENRDCLRKFFDWEFEFHNEPWPDDIH
jgi:hypothetical protein